LRTLLSLASIALFNRSDTIIIARKELVINLLTVNLIDIENLKMIEGVLKGKDSSRA
jgi:hypothetical protein